MIRNHISPTLGFASRGGARGRRRLAVCAVFAAAASLAQCNPFWHLSPLWRGQRTVAQATALNGEAALQQLKRDGGYASLAAAVAAARYQINAAPALPEAPFYADNPEQQLHAIFTPEEFRVRPASTTAEGAELRLRIADFGYGRHLASVTAGTLATQGERITITKSAIGNPAGTPHVIKEWYVNKPEGLEQGFTLDAPPERRQTGEWLRIGLSVGDGWRIRLRGDGHGALFERQADGLRLGYDQLQAQDAAGRGLSTRMELEGNVLALRVDDAQAAYPITIDPIITQQRKLAAADGTADSQFGSAVALSGNTAVIGAPFDAIGGNAAQGSAYVFVRSGAVWSQQQKLTANDGAAGDRFGSAVAISGDTVALGASNDGIGGNAAQGSAYVFVRNGAVWSQQQKLTADDGAVDEEFGSAIALSGDTVLVGAEGDGSGANKNQGAAYVFTRTGAAWTQRQKLTADDGAAGDHFGFSVALSGDTVALGAFGDDIGANGNQGSAYVFTRSDAGWTQRRKLTAFDGAASDNFGFSVALSGDTVVVGANNDDIGMNADQGSVYVFARNGATWTLQQKLTAGDGAASDSFGASVVLSGDTMVVGALGDDIGLNGNQGSAYVFARNGAFWTERRKLTADGGAVDDQFGATVALDGDTVLVGSPNSKGAFAGQGAAYVFAIRANSFAQQQPLIADDGAANDRFGSSVALSGDTLVVGVGNDDIGANGNQGSAYVFVRSGGAWTQQQRLIANDGAANDFFGFSVALSGDTVVVGALGADIGSNENQGAAYVFTRSGTVWTQQQKLTANDGAAFDRFGVSVALSGDTAAVGADGDNIGANSAQGSAYVFTRSGARWTQQKKLTASDGAAVDEFGSSVALDGDTLAVGAQYSKNGSNEKYGAAYVFVRNGGVWTQQQRIAPTDGAPFQGFGFSAALSGDTVVVGMLDDNTYVPGSQGAAYVFTRNGTTWTQQQKLIANDGAFHNYFSTSVAISGDTVVVGAFFDTVGGNGNQGSAYVFTRSGTAWAQQQQLIANDGAIEDNFGVAVAIGGDTVVVTAPLDDIGLKEDQGSAYIFVSPSCPTITIDPASLPDARVNVPYSRTVTASGGSGPYQFSLSDGSLPPGLTLTQNGQISGLPTTAGTYRFAITATIPSSLCPGRRSYTMTVGAAQCPTVIVSPPTLPLGQIGGTYNRQLDAAGGLAPYSFTPALGALPPGLTLASSGLLNGIPTQTGTFNFTAQATDANGCLGTQAYAVTINQATANGGLQFYPLAHPVRLLDTRVGGSGCFHPDAAIAGGTSRTQPAQGLCDGLGIPETARAITGNITTVNSGGGFLTLYPSDAALPLAANSNYGPNEVVNNVFTVGLGADGAFKIFVSSTTDTVVDITGYYAPPAPEGLFFHPLPHPVRLLDTRAGTTGCTTPNAPLAGDTDTPQLARRSCDGVTIPDAAQAIVGNATTVNPLGPGFLTLFPASAARPVAASSNYSAGQIVNGPFTVALSAMGEFNIYTAATTNLVIDVLGYYSAEANDLNGAGLLFTPLPKPVRLLDTRTGATGCFSPSAPLAAGSTRTQAARGVCDGVTIAAGALGLIGNATVVNSNGGYLTFWPSTAAQPLVATSNFTAGQVFNRHFTVGLGAGDGAFKIFTQFQTDLVVDISGYFTP